MGLYPPMTALWSSNQSATIQQDRGLVTVQGAVHPRKLGVLPRLTEILEVWNDLWTGDGTLYPPEVLNDEASPTTVFRAWDNVSTSIYHQTTHSQSIWEARIWIILIYHVIVYFRSWFSALLSVATKRIRNENGQPPNWPPMLA